MRVNVHDSLLYLLALAPWSTSVFIETAAGLLCLNSVQDQCCDETLHSFHMDIHLSHITVSYVKQTSVLFQYL